MRTLSIEKDDIQAAYAALGHEWGWSLLGAPEAQLYTAETVIVGLNPACAQGDKPEDYGFHWDVPEGNVYFSRSWGGGGEFTPLQTQLLRWHKLLHLGPAQSIGVNFVPFRSRSWAKLRSPAESIQFARRLWQDILAVTPASLFLTMGKVAANHLAGAMGARLVAHLPTDWGRQRIDVYDGPGGRRVVAMPHPSRFALMGRGEASQTAESSFRAACDQDRTFLAK